MTCSEIVSTVHFAQKQLRSTAKYDFCKHTQDTGTCFFFVT